MNEFTRDDMEDIDLLVLATAQVMACDVKIMTAYPELSYSELVAKFKPLMESAIIRTIALNRENNGD